jgi:hypothetical protein
VQVVLRLRPLSEKEKKNNETNIWKVYEGVSIILKKEMEDDLPIKRFPIGNVAFNFDKCFNTTATNETVYENTIKNMVDSCVNGINATVFMYGQTGSGKTFTMLGYDQKKGVYNKTLLEEDKRAKSANKKQPDLSFEMKMKQKVISEDFIEETQLENKNGVLIQSLKELFQKLKGDQEKTYFVKCSYVEIYNDLIYDLLQRSENIAETLQVCEDTAKDQFYIRGVREEAIDDWTDAIEKLKRGEINRHYARTVMNHSSSRSHTIFRIYIQSLVSPWNKNANSGGASYVTESWFNFVDLAGSEKVSNHDQIEEGNKLQMRVKEGKHINKSLFFLTQVIKLKSEGKKTHIPFRNSPLTKILRTSLGGNSRTVIILCANPTYSHIEQTLSTIRFGLSAKKIQNSVSANVVTSNDDEAVRIMIADYEKKLRDYEKDRETMRQREKKLVERILEMEKKNLLWANRMKATQCLKFKDMINNVPEKDYEELLMGYNKFGQSHMWNAGLLMFPKGANPKYEKFSSFVRSKGMEMLGGENKEFAELDQRCLSTAYQRPDGQYALETLEKLRNRVGKDLELYNLIRSNWGGLELEGQFEEMLGQMQEVTQISKENIGKVDQLIGICQEECELSSTLQSKVDLYEGKIDFGELAESELESLKTRYEENIDKIKKEKWKRNMLQEISSKRSQFNLDESILKEFKKLQASDFSASKEKPDPQTEQMAYLEQLREQCKVDVNNLKQYEDLEGPSKEELSEAIFNGCEELLEKKSEFQAQFSNHWREYLKIKEETNKEILREMHRKNKAIEESGQKSQVPESLKSMWLEVDELLEKGLLKTTQDDSDNASVSDISSRPYKVQRQVAEADAEEEMEKSEKEEEESGEDNTSQVTPRMGHQDEEIEEVEEEAEEEQESQEEEEEQVQQSRPGKPQANMYQSEQYFQNPEARQEKKREESAIYKSTEGYRPKQLLLDLPILAGSKSGHPNSKHSTARAGQNRPSDKPPLNSSPKPQSARNKDPSREEVESKVLSNKYQEMFNSNLRRDQQKESERKSITKMGSELSRSVKILKRGNEGKSPHRTGEEGGNAYTSYNSQVLKKAPQVLEDSQYSEKGGDKKTEGSEKGQRRGRELRAGRTHPKE